MKITACSMIVVVGGALMLSVSGARAQDWPQWRGANRDSKVTGFVAPKAWPKELTQKWKTAVGSGDASPVLAGEKLIAFGRQETDEVIRCLEAGTGKELWAEKYPVPAISGPDAGQHSGPRSTPAVADGKVVTLGVTGALSCLEAASGKKLWQTPFAPQGMAYNAATPIVAGKRVFVKDQDSVTLWTLD